MIDVATGTGRGALTFSNYSQVSHIVATDVDAQMIEKAKMEATATRFGAAESVSEVLSSEEKGQFDVATVFQAFHWFDAQRVLKELRENVLKDGGILAVAVRIFLRGLPFSHTLTHTRTQWNDRDLNVPWIVEFEELIEKYNKDYDRYQRQCDMFGPVLTEGNYFTLRDTINVPHEMPVSSFEKLLAQSKTLSYVRNVIDRRDESDALSWSHWEEDLREIVHRSSRFKSVCHSVRDSVVRRSDLFLLRHYTTSHDHNTHHSVRVPHQVHRVQERVFR